MTLDSREVEAAIGAAVAHWAPQLRSGAVNAIGLMRAICQNETSGGARWGATYHEAAYCYGGPYYKGDGPGGRPGDDVLRDLTKAWGCLAHQSFGPWQVLYITAYEHGFREDPVLLRLPHVCAEFLVKILNRRLFDKMAGATLEDALDAWNSGQARDANVPAKYVADGVRHYHAFMGDLET